MSPDVVFCSPSATRFNVLSIQRCCSAYFVMHGYLSYCCLPINLKQSGRFVLATTLSQHCNNIESCHSLDILPFFQNILCKPRRRLGGEMPMWKWITMKYSCENGNRMQELQLTDHNWPFIRNIQRNYMTAKVIEFLVWQQLLWLEATTSCSARSKQGIKNLH